MTICNDANVVPDVEVLLRRIGLEASGWRPTEVAHNRWLTPAIWILQRGDERVVLKWLSANRDRGTTTWEHHWTANSNSPRHWNYWLREALAYSHGLADSFAPSGLSAPACIGVDVTADDAVLALAFVDGVGGEHWAIDDYAAAALALGRAQAPYLCGQPLPAHAWLTARFLREYTTDKPVDWSLLDDDRAWDQPLVRDCFPAALRAAAIELHRQRDRLFEIAEGLPTTLCHLDFWSKNLIRRPDGTFVLLDWAFVGIGAVGEDIGNLVPDAAFDHFVPSADLPALDKAVFDGYVDGLAAGGWTADPRIVRLGVLASAVKYDWLTPLMLANASAARHLRYGGMDEEIDATFRFRDRGAALLFNAQRAALALDLAEELGR